MAYDTIIVGAGSAGCVLAARLSEDPKRTVLLLEAGPDYPDPAVLPQEIASSLAPAYTHDWDYFSQPGVVNRSIHLPRGKLVGGCSATNATVAVRGTPGDFDAWAALGVAGWSYADVLPYFRRLETDFDFTDEWHGRSGPLTIRRWPPDLLGPVQHAFQEACLAAGYPYVADYNGPQVTGVGPWPSNGFGGVRQSTARAYLGPARRRSNLTIRSSTLVDRILFAGPRAIGVRLAGSDETVRGGQVIISAGSYNSPAILMRSGLGPADRLRHLRIDVVEDLPGVGSNLIDHPLVTVAYAPHGLAVDGPSFQLLLAARTATGPGDRDLLVFPGGPWQTPAGIRVFFMVALAKPLSRGHLALSTADPASPPLIDPGYFTHPADLPRMREGLAIAQDLAARPPLRDLVTPFADTPAPASEAYVLAHVETFHHPVGTCRMGADGDPYAVVNTQAAVHGVRDLYVVDASIMPDIPSAPTNLATIMLAERCAAAAGLAT